MMADTDNPFEKEEGAPSPVGDAEADPEWAVDGKLEEQEKAGLLGEAGVGEGATGGSSAAASAPKDESNVPACACISLGYYQPFFDVDTSEVATRALRAIWPPAASNFWAVVGPKPDLYGPFWAATTLIFVIAAVSNFTAWLTFDDKSGSEWIYDFSLLTVACSFVYGYWAGSSAVLWMLARYAGLTFTLVQTLCLTGYSMVVYIPVTLLCTTYLETLDWIATIIGLGISLSFVVLNVMPMVKAAGLGGPRTFYLGAVAVSHMVFALALKLYFFPKGTNGD